MKDYYLFGIDGSQLALRLRNGQIQLELREVNVSHQPRNLYTYFQSYKLIEQLREAADYLEQYCGTDSKTRLRKKEETRRTTQSGGTQIQSHPSTCTVCSNDHGIDELCYSGRIIG